MRYRVPAALPGVLLLAVLAAGCSDVVGPPDVFETPSAGAPRNARFDPRLEPAEAVMAVVPASATSLRVTDYDQVRADLEPGDVTVLTDGLLGADSATLRADYGFGVGDVSWEAQWTGPDGDGFAIGLHTDVAESGPSRAVDAGVGPLAGATYYPTTHVLLDHGTVDPTTSWAAERALTDLVGQPASSTYVQRDCVPLDVAFAPGLESSLSDVSSQEISELDPLPAFSVSFGQDIATVRMGEGRDDVAVRAVLADHLPRTDPEFGLALTHAVADPDTGRIGYLVADPQAAERLVRSDQLPFGLCSSDQS